ncbi:MAG TPA: DEAD/DEAH box helicase [Trebonia sp.]|nr:DEAD/DEAH box helicase [Trebonia sp.]
MPETDETETDVTFASLGVPAPLVAVLAQDGIISPFPVQAATLPDALAGRDILGRAQTGSGKTLGFSLPLVTRLADGQTAPGRPRGLVLVPTRELATQVHEVLRPLARAMRLSVTTIYGGVSYGPQVTALRRRTDIIVATPGRLADLINQGECDLADVEVMVIDEADQMADLGFLPIVRRLLESTPAGGQRMLFSATLDAAIDVLVRRFLNNPATHSVNENSSPAEIEHHVLTIDPSRKLEVLAALVGGDKRSLVFTRTKHGAERIARQLTELGIPSAELHGNLRQGARARNLAAFSNGIAQVMVATDIAARGIHVDGIDLVIHADPPAEHKAYVHRSGRTARGGADGVVVTLQMRSQARDVTAMMRKAGITPHTAAAYDPESDVLREIGGPPAPRVSVSGKVSELVRPEDRLAANGAGGPGGRGGYGRGGSGRSRDDRPRRDRQGGGRYGSDRYGNDRPGSDRQAAPARDFAPRDRDERPARFQRDDRPARYDGDRGFARGQRPERARDERSSGERSYGDRSNGDRSYGERSSAGRSSDGRSSDDNRAPRGEFRRDERPYAGRPSEGGRSFGGDRPSAPTRPFRGNRDDRNGGASRPEGNDWWPRENRPASGNGPAGEYRRPGAAGGWRPAGSGGPNRSASGYRPVRDSRNGESGGENRDGSGRGDRPSAGGRPGAARGRSGYSAGRNGSR